MSRFLRCLLVPAVLCAALPGLSALAAPLEQITAEKITARHVGRMDAEDGDPMQTVEATKTIVADLDGDDKPEIVLLWTMLGPTYWSNGVSVFALRGTTYAMVTESREPLGMVEDMKVENGVIRLETKWPRPSDPRCCPTLDKTLRYRWKGGQFLPVK